MSLTGRFLPEATYPDGRTEIQTPSPGARARVAGYLLVGLLLIIVPILMVIARVKLHILYNNSIASHGDRLLVAFGVLMELLALLGLWRVYYSLKTVWSRIEFVVNMSLRTLAISVKSPFGRHESTLSLDGVDALRLKGGSLFLRKGVGSFQSLGVLDSKDAAVLVSRLSELTGLPID
jgi:hypothetical protein